MPRLTRLLLLAVLLAVAALAPASPPAPAANTGDAWVDRTLRDIDAYGQRYPDAFADELVRYFDAPRPLVAGLLAEGAVAPGDLYAGCALAHVAGQPCRAVIAAWRQSGDRGWSGTAQRLGVVPGSAPFARFKQSIVGSYAHWSRPLVATDAPDPAHPAEARGPTPPSR